MEILVEVLSSGAGICESYYADYENSNNMGCLDSLCKIFLEDGFGLSANYPVYLDIISSRLLLSIGYSLYSIVICLS